MVGQIESGLTEVYCTWNLKLLQS